MRLLRLRGGGPRRLLGTVAVLALASSALSACDAAPGDAQTDGAGTTPQAGQEAAQEAGQPRDVVLRSNVAKGAQGVPVDTLLELSAEGAELERVVVTSPQGRLPGRSTDGGAWRATERLEPGTTYAVEVRVGAGDESQVRQRTFRTVDLSLAQQTYASVAPLDGETVGVGMPVVVGFDLPVTDRAAVERQMQVTATPRQAGTWHWISDTEVHYRPREYWKAGTEVSVDLDINGVDAGGGIYGQESRQVAFTVGEAHVYRVDARSHTMKVFSDGDLLRTIPITTGKAGFTTRSGTKVVMEKHDTKRMDSETVGIGGSEAYDIADVQYAMRLTNSGEFIHAAPWSVGSQGSANVSHGCTGLSTENAGWLYDMTRRGDVVEYTGTDRPMTLDNGYGDWNASWGAYRKGSALG
ncbi:L,D-transpeptidase [Nocardioides dokdonensis]|uniref:L,D-transpeptidase n=1 Tax=Nocardioides dokdonensis TaxID=450734 RepID=UPI0008371368|nr:Ig-like domain-containing protein [Nocardioides dokdonensis]